MRYWQDRKTFRNPAETPKDDYPLTDSIRKSHRNLGQTVNEKHGAAGPRAEVEIQILTEQQDGQQQAQQMPSAPKMTRQMLNAPTIQTKHFQSHTPAADIFTTAANRIRKLMKLLTDEKEMTAIFNAVLNIPRQLLWGSEEPIFDKTHIC